MSLGELVPVFCYEVAFFATMMFLPVMAFKAEVETFIFGAIVMFMCLRVIRKRLQKTLPTDGKAVFITGCDTGFGHMAALRLHNKGYKVFAGCLEPEGKGPQELKEKCADRMHVVPIDVTNDTSVLSAKEYVEQNLDDTCLWALVNNAGTFSLGDVELCTLETFKRVTDVNYFGMIRVTQQFLPMIRKSRGRVVVMSSIGARFPWPSSSAYNASKSAVECVTGSLRTEMRRFGVKVTSVQPAMFGGSTEIHGKENVNRYKTEMERCWDSASEEIKTTYHKKYLENQVEAVSSNRKSLDAKSPDPVIDAIEAGVSNENPDKTYVVHGGPFYVDPVAIYGTLYGFLPQFVTDWLACKVMGISPAPIVQSPSRTEVNGSLKICFKLPSVKNETEDTTKGVAELSEEEQKCLPLAWRLLGGADNEPILVRDLGRILRGFGKNPSEQEVQFLIFDNGLNENQSLDYEQALPLYIKCKSEVSTASQLKAAFRVFDPDGTGKITADDLRDILTRLGENMTKHEFEKLCKKADRDETGIIAYEEFCKTIMGDNRPQIT